MTKFIDLTGFKFGNYIVLNKSNTIKGKIYWNCVCKKCNKEKNIQGNHLRNNSFKNCCIENKSKKLEMGICLICNNKFTKIEKGYSRKFCFDCSPKYDKSCGRSQNITQIRKSIKKELVRYKGGKCEKCGYSKSINALQFHHKIPSNKEFAISKNITLSKFNMENYYKEVDKCELLCANCHFEEHDVNLN